MHVAERGTSAVSLMLFFSASTLQFLNFALMPLHMRTAFMGCCAFLWATFLCFSRQNGDGTAGVALAFVMDPRKTLEEMREARLARKKQKTQRENWSKVERAEEDTTGQRACLPPLKSAQWDLRAHHLPHVHTRVFKTRARVWRKVLKLHYEST